MKRIASATIFTQNLKRPFFDETYRDFDPEELLPLQLFSKELEEVVFDETYRFCNDFYIELEEAVFR